MPTAPLITNSYRVTASQCLAAATVNGAVIKLHCCVLHVEGFTLNINHIQIIVHQFQNITYNYDDEIKVKAYYSPSKITITIQQPKMQKIHLYIF